MISLVQAALSAQQIDWYSFLSRPRLPSPNAESLAPLEGMSILVTGAGGSIGSALSLRLAQLRPQRLALLDASEQALHRLQAALAEAALPTQRQLILADITDHAHLGEIFETHRPRLVFHAAAYKHVPLLEEHPLEAIANNALGTLTVAECAKRFGAMRMVLLSTDKAVAPTSILGASKRIAERITLAYDGVVVRLGNVLGTEGSVSETFLRQIAAGGPVTLTDPNAERYFITCEEAVDLLLASAVSAQSGSLVIPQLNRQHRIASLADFLIAQHASPATVPLVCIGLRHGDKAREALWSSDEESSIAETSGYFAIKQQREDSALLACDLERLKMATRTRALAEAMDIVREMVPAYEPSAAMHALLQQTAPGVTQR